MDELAVSRLADMRELEGFSCGLAEIDGIVFNFLPERLAKGSSNIYAVWQAGCDAVCAVFVLRRSRLTLDTGDINELHGDFTDIEEADMLYEHYPAVELYLLAVHEKLQHRHIGRAVHYHRAKPFLYSSAMSIQRGISNLTP